MEAKRRRVAVIGAGAAGLVTARDLTREGHSVRVFEQNAGVGGVWSYSEAVEDDLLGLDPHRERVHSSLYASVRTNLPREIMSFCDWPFIPEAMGGRSLDARRFCRHEEVQQYLELFADEFDVRRLISFSTRVVAVRQLPGDAGDPRWRVTTCSTSGDAAQEASEEFDAVCCCVGTYYQPNLPAVPGLRDFPGRQLHCHNFRRASTFRGERVLVVGASFSGDEIARLVAAEASQVLHTARSWASETYQQPRANLRRVAWLAALTPAGEAVFADGERQRIDSVMYCTGYQYCFPFLEGTGLVSTEDGHVDPVFLHIFVPAAPSLCFIGLLWKSLRFPQFELQAKLVARVLSGRAALPSRAEQEAGIAAFYRQLREAGVPLRYAHNQSDAMPVSQWQYNARIARLAGPDVGCLEEWRLRIHACQSRAIFARPESFRDEWTAEERAAFGAAEAACQRLLERRAAARAAA